MTEFIASNGVKVSLDGDYIVITQADDYFDTRTDGTPQALREFFQAERDEALGRWRWPENPEYVVYPMGLDHDGFRYARCANERLAAIGTWQEGQSVHPPITNPDHLGIYAVAAYFDAHPEPMPWRDAEAGEVWVIRLHGEDVEDERAVLVETFMDTHVFQLADAESITTTRSDITHGRRIWPERNA